MKPRTLLTADELEQMPDDDSVQIELDEGELITMPPAGEEHSDLEAEILSRIRLFAKRHKLGKVYPGDAGFRLNDGTVRCPDVAFVRQKRLASIRGSGFISGPPDLAVEIFSPTDSLRQLHRKVKQYFAAGCRTVWVVHPERKEVDVFESDGSDRTITAEELLEAPELLPGFSVRVGNLFVTQGNHGIHPRGLAGRQISRQ